MAATSTGTIDFHYQSATYQTWYKLFGDLKSTGVRPLVTLHGGPGIPHGYMSVHADLFASHGIPVIVYDQIGIGNSTHLKDAPKEFWTVELFMDELQNLLDHLGISGDFDLLGHSWGGMFGSNFVAARRPAGLKHLIIAGSSPSTALWEESMAQLMLKMPPDVQDTILSHEETGTVDALEYKQALAVFYGKHLCTLTPWPEDLTAGLMAMKADPTVAHAMLNPYGNAIKIVGTLKGWSVIDILHNINCPTLIINGANAQDMCQMPFFERIPKVKWVQFGKSSHVPFHEEREKYMEVVGTFLTRGV